MKLSTNINSDLRQALLHLNKGGMISYIQTTPSAYPDLIKLALADEPRYSWRAAWLLWIVMEINDKRLRRHLPKIAGILPERNESHQRELMIILQKMELPDTLAAPVFDFCITAWNNPSAALSMRYNALKLISRITDSYPELQTELSALAADEVKSSLPKSLRRCADKLLLQRTQNE
ncbi:MAG: hypothetical protein IT279_06195 [Ignavibacteriaceae bacterium]|nr:hypothetical protein [Ignavibacteriaceae bacterium]